MYGISGSWARDIPNLTGLMTTAIGYVDANINAPGTRTLLVVSGGKDERTLLTRIEPVYPETPQKMHIGGSARLAVTIAPTGKVDDVVVLGGNPILAESAAAAVKQWFIVQAVRARH